MKSPDPERILKRLDWTVLRRLDGLLQGDYRTLFRGFGLDLADLREYQFSDDTRYIDWNVTARLQTPHVRQYVEERELTAWFLLDLSPSMDFGTAKTLKRSLLIDLVGILARLLTRHGNRVGAIIYADRVVRVIPPLGGRPQVLRIVDCLLHQPRLDRSPVTDMSAALHATLRLVKRRSLVFVVSDFVSAPGWERPFALLARRHEVLPVRLYDPREEELPDIGFTVLQDAETGEALLVNTHDAGFRRRFAEAAGRREYELRLAFGRAAVDVMSLSTEDDLAREILRFAVLRKGQKKLTAAGGGASPRHRALTGNAGAGPRR